MVDFVLRGSQPTLILLTFRELKYLEFGKVFNIVTLNLVMMWTEVDWRTNLRSLSSRLELSVSFDKTL